MFGRETKPKTYESVGIGSGFSKILRSFNPIGGTNRNLSDPKLECAGAY
jgi:hypothetical protein